MAVSLLDNFAYNGKKPDFERSIFSTLENMKNFSENYLPSGYQCFCEEDNNFYRYKASNSVDPVTGKWRLAEGGGSADLTNYYTKSESDEITDEIKESVEDLSDEIGDMSAIEVSTWTDLVTAINGLNNKFLDSITYSNKKIILTYKDSSTKEIDVSEIIADIGLGSLNDVVLDEVADSDVVAYDVATNKWVNKVFDLASVLQDAKDYTDEEIVKAQENNAIACDEKPTYDSESDTVTYTIKGETKQEEKTKSWFYYIIDGVSVQTRWINGVEFTIDVGSINLDDYVNKDNDVASVYVETITDVNKIPNLNFIKGLISAINTNLGKKVNTEDIVDNLITESTDVPLSANQGKVLNDSITELSESLDGKLDIQQSVDNAGKHLAIDEKGKICFVEGGDGDASQITYENSDHTNWNTVKKALDGVINKLFYVAPSITSFTMTPSTTDYEVGQEVTELSFAWTYNKEITSQSLSSVTLDDETVRSGTWSGSLKTGKTFTLTCSDGEKTATSSKTISFKNKIYWGSASIPAEYNSAFILGLSNKQFGTSKKGSFSMTVASGQFGYICMPTSFGTVASCWIGGFEVTLNNCGSISFTNASGGVTTYGIYKTEKSGLGPITMEIK